MTKNILNYSFDKIPDRVVENIYIGDLLNAYDINELKSLGITHILICASYMEPLFPNVINNKFIFILSFTIIILIF